MFFLSKIRAVRQFLTKKAFAQLILSLVMSHLDYNNALLINLPKVQICKLQRIQNIAAKIVCSKRKFDSVTDCLVDLHWLPIMARIDFKIMLLVYGCVKGTAPNYLQQLIRKKTTNRTLRSGSKPGIILDEPFTKCKTFADRSFSVAGPKLWNKLPADIQLSQSETVFKKKLKTHLFVKYLL